MLTASACENIKHVDAGKCSSYSLSDRSTEDVDHGESAGDCTISCRNDGSIGAYTSTGLRWCWRNGLDKEIAYLTKGPCDGVFDVGVGLHHHVNKERECLSGER
jgi:hypothetical protein